MGHLMLLVREARSRTAAMASSVPIAACARCHAWAAGHFAVDVPTTGARVSGCRNRTAVPPGLNTDQTQALCGPECEEHVVDVPDLLQLPQGYRRFQGAQQQQRPGGRRQAVQPPSEHCLQSAGQRQRVAGQAMGDAADITHGGQFDEGERVPCCLFEYSCLGATASTLARDPLSQARDPLAPRVS